MTGFICHWRKTMNEKMVTVEYILAGNFELVKTLETNQHMALIDKFDECEILKTSLCAYDTDDNFKAHKEIENIGKYMLMLESTLVMSVWNKVTALNQENGIALH